MTVPFATLTPINQQALEAFDSLFTSTTNDARLAYYRQFVHFNPQQTTIDETLKKFSAAPDSPLELSSPSDGSFHSNRTNTTEEDGGFTDRQRLIHTGHYTFSFQCKLLFPQFGWRFGCGRHWRNASRQDKRCDLLFAQPSWQEFRPLQISSEHASFKFNSSGVFGVSTHLHGRTTIGDIQLSDPEAFVSLLRDQTVIHFAGMQYLFAFCVPKEAENSHQITKAEYITETLGRERPIISISATPMPTDLWVGRWRVVSAVGGGTESFFTSAHTIRGEEAVVKRLDRTIATEQQVADEIAQYKRLYDVLHKDKDPRSPYILRLRDVIYTSGQSTLDEVPFKRDEAYLLLSPLARYTFGTGLSPRSSTPHLTKLLLFHQILLGLDLLHTRGIVHRDIKPENLCIATLESGREHAFIIDLGSAKWTTHAHPDILCTPGHGGTVGFLAPEQEVAGSFYGRPVDVFALGCVGYWLFSGSGQWLLPRQKSRSPWRSDWRDSGLARAEQADFERKRNALATGLTSPQARVENLLREMLHIDPDRRITVTTALQHSVWQDLPPAGTTASTGSKRLH